MKKKKLLLIFIFIILLLSTMFPSTVLADFNRDTLKKSIFKVYVDYVVSVDGLGTGTISVQGTCFAIGKKGEKIKYLVTNYHVMNPNEVIMDVANQIIAELQKKGRSVSVEDVAKLIHIQEMHPFLMLYDAPIAVKLTKPMPDNDLAVIEIVNDNERLTVDPLAFGDPNTVKTGDKVYAYGFPAIVGQLDSFYLGTERVAARPSDVSFTNGEVNQKTQVSLQGSYPLDVIMTTVPVSPGNSGGPLVNENGEVIGINTYGDSQGHNYSVAMVPNYLLSLLDNIGISYEKAAAPAMSTTAAASQVPTASPVAKLFAKPFFVAAVTIGAILIVLVIVLVAVLASRKRNDSGQAGTLAQNNSINQNPITPENDVKNQINPILTGVSGYFAGNSLSLAGMTIIGRDPAQCQLVFPANTTDVSRRHCCISFNAATQSFVLEDLNSSNGTYLANGQRVVPGHPHYLKNGEKFYLGVPGNMFEVRA